MELGSLDAETLAKKFWFASAGTLGGVWHATESVRFDEENGVQRVKFQATWTKDSPPRTYDIALAYNAPLITSFTRLED